MLYAAKTSTQMFVCWPRLRDTEVADAPQTAPVQPRAAAARRDVKVSTRSRRGGASVQRRATDEARGGSRAAGSAPGGTRDTNGMCAKCDKDHDTEACPAFRKPREEHPDAQRRSAATHSAMGEGCDKVTLFLARVVRQPGDGSCLYHSLCYGLGMHAPGSATRLRGELADWVLQNGDATIADTPVRDWVRWDSGSSCREYSTRMKSGGTWGGAIEMAACAHLRGVDIHVYERQLGGFAGFKRIASFTCPRPAGGARSKAIAEVHVLYAGGVHYDALLPTLNWQGRL